MLHYYQETTTPEYPLGIGFYIDRIAILSFFPFYVVRNDLSYLQEDRQESSYFKILATSHQAKKGYFKSRIEIGVPSRRCLEKLSGYFSYRQEHRISYLEITRDIFYPTEKEAIGKLFDKLNCTRRKYSSKQFIYDQRHQPTKERFADDKEGLISPQTGYYGPDKFRYVIYARLSKINAKPCLHDEWRILPPRIREKTGIRTLRDLLDLDIHSFFDKQYHRLITAEEKPIYLERLGRWLLDWGFKKKLTNEQEARIYSEARDFCKTHKIRTYLDLTGYIKKRQEELKTKRGGRTLLDKKIFKLTDYARFSRP